MPDVAAAENPSQLAPPEPGLRHRLPHRSAGSADRIPAGTTANAGPIEPTTLGRDRHRAAVTRRPLPHHRAYGSVHGGSGRVRTRTHGRPSDFKYALGRPTDRSGENTPEIP